MTGPHNQGEQEPPYNPRHRLVGGLVLLALAVIFVPMVLDFRSDYEGGIRDSNIPPRPEDFKVEILPLTPPRETVAPPPPLSKPATAPGSPAEPSAKSTPAAVSASGVTAPAESSPEKTAPPRPPATAGGTEAAQKAETREGSNPRAQGRETERASPVGQPAEAARETATEVGTGAGPRLRAGWVVQVGSFTSRRNALRLRDRLRKSGFVAFLGEIRMDGKPAYRVLVGPVADQARAEAQRNRLLREAGIKGIVMRYLRGD